MASKVSIARGAGQLGAGDFDAREVAVVADAELAKAEVRRLSSDFSICSRTSRVTARPYSTREERQGAAGRSQRSSRRRERGCESRIW